MKDSIYYENRFFIKLQEMFSEKTRQNIQPTERAEIYYFWNYEKIKLFIKRSRNEWQICGKEAAEILNEKKRKIENQKLWPDRTPKIEIKDIKQFYDVYYQEKDWNKIREKYNEILKEVINELQL